jgi:hypothetical protein
MNKHINNKGFTLVEALIIIVIVAGLGFAGWIVYKHNQQTSSANQSCPPGETQEYPVLNKPISEETPYCVKQGSVIADKPVIYLYPTHEEQVEVKLSYITGFSKTTPSYNPQMGWRVLAQPNGTLNNLADGKQYPYLYWEGNSAPLHFDLSKGFVVAGSDTKSFLQEQLISMGLSQTETAAFINYWLPKMENNPYNLIHFF